MSNLFSEKPVSDITQFHNPLLNSDENRKRKASTWILGDYPEENLSRATKKLKSESRLVLDEEEEEEEGSCVTSTSCSRVSVQHKSEPSLRAATMKCRFAETILRAQQKQGLVKSVDVERYKLDAKEEVRKAVQKQREAARKKLEDLEKSIVVVDNFKVLKDFESLIGCHVSRSYVGCR